jgi:hypothetical protein
MGRRPPTSSVSPDVRSVAAAVWPVRNSPSDTFTTPTRICPHGDRAVARVVHRLQVERPVQLAEPLRRRPAQRGTDITQAIEHRFDLTPLDAPERGAQSHSARAATTCSCARLIGSTSAAGSAPASTAGCHRRNLVSASASARRAAVAPALPG